MFYLTKIDNLEVLLMKSELKSQFYFVIQFTFPLQEIL